MEVGDGWYVLGDFTRDSLDSRFDGPIRRTQLIGHAWMIVKPWRRLGWVR